MSIENFRQSSRLPFANEISPLLSHTAVPSPGNWKEVLSEIKGQSLVMESLLSSVSRIARSDCPVLINGESGTGKELVARALHRLSPRANKRFIAINAGAIPESLMESELFGYVKGAFTGADQRRKGYFEEAAGGTIFLDEIGDMPLRLQAKLLRVIQEKQFSPIGSAEIKRSDVRVIAATNVNLEDAVKANKFRLDLFYRLNVLPIKMPALRERHGDVKLLLDHFITLANQQYALTSPCYFTSEVYLCLEAYSWPGNVRELQNLVERLVVMAGGGPIKYQDLPIEYKTSEEVPRPPTISTKTLTSPSVSKSEIESLAQGMLPEEGLQLTKYIEDLENALILQALERTGHNKNQAAKLLGLNRTTLVERIKKRRLAPLNSPSKEL